uniref:uncharacterized protein LOC120829229 n=1 Tax=Gasterosteus aculeatus aculeatus TaxID=481459 RepID=UPI001A98031F|nr:uncharacterized protein LOC120829229 [Gasterosteus aculeatus aculeatus]
MEEEEEEGKMATCSRNLKVETGVCRMRRSLFCAVLCVSVLVTPGTCCLSKEYELQSRQCCPMCYEGSVVKRDCTSQSGIRCVPCVDGTYMDRPNGLNKCFPCSSCDQGSVVKRDCTPQSGTRCVPCVDGTYMDRPTGRRKGFNCSSCEQGRGLFAKQNCTSTSDTVCDVIAGHFCTDLIEDKECRSARRHSDCKPGHRVKEPGTRRTDTTCEPCPAGSFSLEGVNCSLWTTCSENQVEVKGGTLTSDTVCGAASGGRYWEKSKEPTAGAREQRTIWGRDVVVSAGGVQSGSTSRNVEVERGPLSCRQKGGQNSRYGRPGLSGALQSITTQSTSELQQRGDKDRPLIIITTRDSQRGSTGSAYYHLCPWKNPPSLTM